jgi:hypothetical protein
MAATVLLGAGCSPADSASRTLIRDSAGITIVESMAADAGARWAVSDSPLVRIGAVYGDENEQLFRASDGTILRDGTIVVVNGGTDELRFYDANGQFLRRAGGAGDGPGELRSPRRIFRHQGDSLVVAERTRLSWFGPDGRYLRSTPLPMIHPEAMFADGSLAGWRFATGQDPFVLGTSRPQMAIIRWWPLSGDTATLALVPGGAVFSMSIEGGIISYDAGFGPHLSIASSGDELIMGDGVRFEVQVRGPDGAIRRIHRREIDAVPVTPEAQRRYEEYLLSSVRSERQRVRLERLFSEWTLPEQQPYFDRILVDERGHSWLREYTYDARSAARWSILDADGAWIGDLRMPAGLEIWEIGEDYILGLVRDADDVEFVVRHGLTR